jgi:Tol biopolymer transport system component
VSWSPDGTQIAFVLNYAFHIMNADGSGLRSVDFHEDAAFVYRPAWQPVRAGS